MRKVAFRLEVDDLGRILLPTYFQQEQGIEPGDTVEFYEDKDKIIFKLRAKHGRPRCLFCGDAQRGIRINGNDICKECLKIIKEL